MKAQAVFMPIKLDEEARSTLSQMRDDILDFYFRSC
jgi:hypothetical protein